MLFALLAGMIGGCGDGWPSVRGPLFVAPLEINGEPAGSAIIDTGGAYELILRENFGLRIVDHAEVLAFLGSEQVGVTESFPYLIGGIGAVADGALVGLSVCDCNGVGIFFFRKTGTIVSLDFPSRRAEFGITIPPNGVVLPFDSPPARIGTFDSAFIEVHLAIDNMSRPVIGLLDTGTGGTVIAESLVAQLSPASAGPVDITIERRELGTVAATVSRFDTPGLPDIIIGTDVMRAWGDRWYFHFAPRGGTVTVFLAAARLDVPPAAVPTRGRHALGPSRTLGPSMQWPQSLD